MNLYHVQFDGQSYWVEAPSFGAAVMAWKSHVKTIWGDDYDGNEEPESVHCIHNKPVIRCATDGAEEEQQ